MGVILMDSFSSQLVSEALFPDSGANKGNWYTNTEEPGSGFGGVDGYYKGTSGSYMMRHRPDLAPSIGDYRTVAFAIWPRSTENQGPLPFWGESNSNYPTSLYNDFFVSIQSDGSVRVHCGPGAAQVHQTAPGVVPMDAWSWISYTCQWSTTPYWSVSVNGVEIANSATYGGGSVTGEAWNFFPTGNVDSAGSFYMDDLILTTDQAAVPPMKVVDLIPASTAQGQWTGSDGNSADNHLLVRDFADTATYVEAPTAGLTDLYGHGYTFTAAPLAVQVIGSMRYDGIGANGSALVLKSGTAEATRPAVPVDAWTIYTMDPQGKDPNTAAPWTAAAANALTFGVRST